MPSCIRVDSCRRPADSNRWGGPPVRFHRGEACLRSLQVAFFHTPNSSYGEGRYLESEHTARELCLAWPSTTRREARGLRCRFGYGDVRLYECKQLIFQERSARQQAGQKWIAPISR
jgi:hypothetical protein